MRTNGVDSAPHPLDRASRVRTVMVTLDFFILLLLTVTVCVAGPSCPPLAEFRNGGGARTDGESAPSEFSCTEAKWNRDKLREEIRYILKTEQKKFIRFRAPVKNYAHPRLGGGTNVTENATERRITWVWVADKFSYMLFYPQNFQTLSLGTADVVSENTEEAEIRIDCTGCGESVSCGVGFFELKGVIELEAKAHGLEWEYLCVEADNGVLDIVSPYPLEQELRMLNSRNFALPDILYQSRFLKLFFSRCSFLSLACENVNNYFCYRYSDGSCTVKMLLSHYPKIIYLSVVLWFFLPLLVIYLPSSKPVHSVTHISNMFPTHKVPVYLGRYIKNCLFCYHTTVVDVNGPILIRLRRTLGFIVLSTLSFRFLLFPSYQPSSFIIFALFLTAVLWPQHLSVYIRPEIPQYFPLFNEPYPEGMVKLRGSRANSIEYQRLAYIMLERMYLPFDCKFWGYVCENSFRGYHACFDNQQAPVFFPLRICRVTINCVVGVITVSLSVFIVFAYFVLPLPYFAKELFLAINSGVYQHCQIIWTSQNRPTIVKLFETILSFIHASVLCVLLLYLVLTLFSLCFLLTEVTIFTYLGASIAADIVFHYVVLLVAFGSTVYAIVHSIHKKYLGILKATAQILENDSEIDYIKLQIRRRRGMRLSLHKTARDGVQLIGNQLVQYRETLYLHRDLVNYVSTGLYFSIAESVQPIRRQVPLVFVKLFLMLFFIGLSLWTKNVYKNESIVSDIFSVAEKMAVLFIPAVLEWFSSQGQFGRGSEAQQRIDIVHALLDYAQKQSDSI